MKNFNVMITADFDGAAEMLAFLSRVGGNTSSVAIAPTVEAAVDVSTPAADNDHTDFVPAFTYGVNVYESSRQAFALGSKLYADRDDASNHRTRNGSWITSFTLVLDANGVALEQDCEGVADERFFAVLSTPSGFELGRNSYDNASFDLLREYPSRVNIIAIAVDDNNNVSIRNV